MESFVFIWDAQAGNAFVVKAFASGQVVGQASGRWHSPDACELENVEVVETWRRRGIGRALVCEVQARASHITACSISEAGAGLLRSSGFIAGEDSDVHWSWWETVPVTTGDRDY